MHRFGVTVSRRYSRSAVRRNRAKRLLRETFRQSAPLLNCLKGGYDWVLLPKKRLERAKLDAPLADFRGIIEMVAAKEKEASVSGLIKSSGGAL
jgi:ribonuclease P protein component